jgi:hypothetical protein
VNIFYSIDFKKSVKKLSKRYKNIKKDLQEFVSSLEYIPRQGTELLSDVYKVRLKNSDNKGKSSGYRVITYLITKDEILLVDIYTKNDTDNITDKEINIMIKEYKKEK